MLPRRVAESRADLAVPRLRAARSAPGGSVLADVVSEQPGAEREKHNDK
jgi:hypothetical protein